jgi:hypothetical protein
LSTKIYTCTLGLSYKYWRDNLEFVLNTINSNRPRYSRAVVMSSFFLGERPPSLPQKEDSFYKFSVGEVVRFNLPRQQRLWPYKYSLKWGE